MTKKDYTARKSLIYGWRSDLPEVVATTPEYRDYTHVI